jgi:2-C-methyl-D-erythritol 4-phosphate cytidylyltransferase
VAASRKKNIGKVVAIIVAAGEGSRFKTKIPKQWSDLYGRPLVAWALTHFQDHPAVDEIILVIDPAHRSRAKTLAKNDFPKIATIVSGGKTRADSVRRGLSKMTRNTNVVLIHDSARPLIDDGLIDKLIAKLEIYEGAVPVTLVGVTHKRLAGDEVESTVDRKGLASVKTPQAFRAYTIRKAHALAAASKFEATDDSVVVENYGGTVGVVHTTYPNIKVTLPDELRVIEAIIAAEEERRR